MSQALKERLRPGGVVVNVCSRAGHITAFGEPARSRVAAAASRRDVEALVEEFVSSVTDGSYGSKGFPGTMYGVSKALEAAYSRVLAAELAPRGITVSAMCPGYVATSMSSWRGTKVKGVGEGRR